MFAYPVSTESASSSLTWSYSSEIDLHAKWNDSKRLALKVDIAADLSQSSAAVDVNFGIADRPGGTYAFVVTGSGTSVILTSGTSKGGQGANGSYFIPLTIVTNSGVTEWLTAGVAPYVKIGTRSSDATPALSMKLLCG